MKKTTLRLLPLGGVAAPILFSLIIIISASMIPDYNHLHNFISALGATGSSSQQLMNYVGFIPTGLLLVLFGFSLGKALPSSLSSKVGFVLMIIFGTGVTLAGVFSCDPGCPQQGSTEALIHDAVSVVAFVSAILGILFLSYTFRRQHRFKLMIHAILSGFFAAIFLYEMISTMEAREYTGMWQRLLLFMIFQWTAVMGLNLYFRPQAQDHKEQQ
jgi:hypothetical membrane protein